MFSSFEEIYIAAFSTALMMLMLVAIVVIAFVKYQRRYRKHIEEVVSLKQSYDQEIIKTRLEISEETLNKVSREIHDNIGQMLALVKLNLFTIDTQDQKMIAERVHQARVVISKIIEDVRNLSHTLNPEYLQRFQLYDWIKAEAELVRKNSSIEVSYHVEEPEPDIDPRNCLIVMRIIQEIINNVVKHSQATKLAIEINHAPDQVRLTLADNGVGFNPESVREGLGLANLKIRSRVLNAHMNIISAIGKGTTIELILPHEHQR